MTVKEFKEEFNDGAFELDELAYMIRDKIDNNSRLVDIADNYLKYEALFLEALEEQEIELG